MNLKAALARISWLIKCRKGIDLIAIPTHLLTMMNHNILVSKRESVGSMLEGNSHRNSTPPID